MDTVAVDGKEVLRVIPTGLIEAPHRVPRKDFPVKSFLLREPISRRRISKANLVSSAYQDGSQFDVVIR